MEAILEQLIQSPKLGLYIQELEEILRKEQTKRSEFYGSISEGDKVEFINGEVIFHSPLKLRHNESGKFLLALLDAYVRIQ